MLDIEISVELEHTWVVVRLEDAIDLMKLESQPDSEATNIPLSSSDAWSTIVV